jgi:hypothetical protein
MTETTITTEQLMSNLDAAQAKTDELYARVNKGLAWLKTHTLRDPQYARAEVLLAELQDELKTGQAEMDVAEKALQKALETRPDTGQSLRCQVCGGAIRGETKPGYYTHIDCLGVR